MSFFQAILLGIVEGFTEFLPISSTAHLIIASQLLKIPSSDFLTSFEIVIQLGAILAVIVLFWQRVWRNKKILIPIISGFIPTMALGLLAYDLVKEIFLKNFSYTIFGLILGGLFLLLVEMFVKEKSDHATKLDSIPVKKALIIGIGQAAAMVPGMSRSAMTIGTGKLLGLPRETAVEFSFLMATPVMLGATVLDLTESYKVILANDWRLIAVGFVTAFVVALASMKWLMDFAKKHSLAVFGWYRVALGLLLFLLSNK